MLYICCFSNCSLLFSGWLFIGFYLIKVFFIMFHVIELLKLLNLFKIIKPRPTRPLPLGIVSKTLTQIDIN